MKLFNQLIAASVLCVCSQAVAETIKTPKGWKETKTRHSRLITKSTARVEVFDWTDLKGLAIDAYLKRLETVAPRGAEYISSEGIKPVDTVPGAFSVTRNVKWNGKKSGTSIVLACPGLPGKVRILSFDDSASNLGAIGRILSGGIFMEKVCKQEQKAGEIVSASAVASNETNSSAPRIKGRDLAKENAKIPKENHPDASYLVSKNQIQGFGITAMMLPVPHMMMTFPNGYSTYCKKWDLVTQSPTPDSIGENCKLTTESIMDSPTYSKGPGPKPGPLYPFEPGETLDMSLGSLSGVGYDWGSAGQTNFVSSGELTLKKDGRVIIGSSILSSIAPNADVLATGKRKESSGGRYYLNGYTITIETDTGDLSHSYIGSFHDKDKVTAVMFRDKFYSARLKGN